MRIGTVVPPEAIPTVAEQVDVADLVELAVKYSAAPDEAARDLCGLWLCSAICKVRQRWRAAEQGRRASR